MTSTLILCPSTSTYNPSGFSTNALSLLLITEFTNTDASQNSATNGKETIIPTIFNISNILSFILALMLAPILKAFLPLFSLCVLAKLLSQRGTRKRFCCHIVHARLRKHINYPLSVRPIGFRNISTFFQFVRCPSGTYQRVFGHF